SKLNPFPKGDIRYTPTFEEMIREVNAFTVDEFRKLYQQLGAKVGECAVVGEFDPAATRDALQQILEGWNASVPYERIPQIAKLDVPGGRFDILTPDKANAVYVAKHLLQMSDRHPDYYALVAANVVFCGNPLSSRLGDRIRQKEGLSYTFGS